MKRRAALTWLAAGIWVGSGLILPLSQGLAMPVGENPATLLEKDKGVLLPVSLVRGQVNNQASRYLLGPGDKIAIKIEHLAQFNQDFTVRPDGFATIHPFGEHQVSGTDVQGLQTILEKEFRLYLLEPHITVDVREMRPALLYIHGAVQHPGTYQFGRERGRATAITRSRVQEGVVITLTNVLGKVGGLKPNADIEHIEVVHAATGQKEMFNLGEFLTQAGSQNDLWLLPEDTVMVPERLTPVAPDLLNRIGSSADAH